MHFQHLEVLRVLRIVLQGWARRSRRCGRGCVRVQVQHPGVQPLGLHFVRYRLLGQVHFQHLEVLRVLWVVLQGHLSRLQRCSPALPVALTACGPDCCHGIAAPPHPPLRPFLPPSPSDRGEERVAVAVAVAVAAAATTSAAHSTRLPFQLRDPFSQRRDLLLPTSTATTCNRGQERLDVNGSRLPAASSTRPVHQAPRRRVSLVSRVCGVAVSRGVEWVVGYVPFLTRRLPTHQLRELGHGDGLPYSRTGGVSLPFQLDQRRTASRACDWLRWTHRSRRGGDRA